MTRWSKEETGVYWVVGGKYADPEFKRLAWAAPALGPFRNRADAEASWRSLSFAYAAQAAMRFSIVEEVALDRAA